MDEVEELARELLAEELSEGEDEVIRSGLNIIIGSEEAVRALTKAITVSPEKLHACEEALIEADVNPGDPVTYYERLARAAAIALGLRLSDGA